MSEPLRWNLDSPRGRQWFVLAEDFDARIGELEKERDDLRAMLTKVEDWMERSEVRRMEYLSAKESAEAEVARLSALLRKAEEALVWCADAPMCETDRFLGRTEEEIASDMLAWLNRKPDHYNETLDRPRLQERRVER